MVTKRPRLQMEFARAQKLQKAGRYSEAERAWLDLDRRASNHAGVLTNLAMVQWQLGAFDKSEITSKRAIAVGPDMVQAHVICGAATEARGAVTDAITHYERVLELKPEFTSVMHSLANLHRRQGNLDKALRYATEMIAIKPKWAKGYDVLGAVQLAIGNLGEASDALIHAIQLDPTLASAHGNLGMVKAERREWLEALGYLERALSLDPSLAEAHNNHGNVLVSLNRLVEAGAAFDRSLKLAPESTDTRFNQSLLWLKQGRWVQAWPGFELRWQTRQLAPFKRLFRQPLWNGEKCTQRTLLIHAEQGAGDFIMVLRYLPELRDCVGQLIIECSKELTPLIKTMGSDYTCVSFGDVLPNFDLHLPAMSLPGVFKTKPETIPWNGPYISAPKSEIKALHKDKTINIGLVWTGSVLNPTNSERSVPLIKLKPILEFKHCRFFSLQHGSAGDEINRIGFRNKIIDTRSELKDFGATAAMVSQMDIVISVCTSVAHLAGAMGKPTWVMLSKTADWRWLADRVDTPWYPSMELFRQSTSSNWDTVINRICAKIEGLHRGASG